MSKYIHPATLEAALRVASNLLPDDYREVKEGHGHDPFKCNGRKFLITVTQFILLTQMMRYVVWQESMKMDKSGCYVPQQF